MTPREKIVKLLLRILAHPYRFTRKQLAGYLEVDESNLKKYINSLKNVGLEYDQDKQNRAAILPQRGFKELERLQFLTESDRNKIAFALNRLGQDKDSLYILKKLDSLYNFQQLGLRALRRPELDKIDKLETAKKEKRQVVLENYRSNSNETKNRVVECFDIDTVAGMIQVVDTEKLKIRHFKLNRIERVKILVSPWEHEDKHHPKDTDVFRIADNNRIMVHLQFDSYAYNILADTFPQAIAACLPGPEPNTFDFQAKVNAKFIGLINFIMGNSKHIEVLFPDELKDELKDRAKKILEKH